MRNKPSILAKGAGLVAMFSLNAGAVQIDLALETTFSGVSPASTNTPWMCAQFTTVGNDVLFTLTAPNLTDPEGAEKFYFNFDDTLDVSSLSFGSPTTSGSFMNPSVNIRGANQNDSAFKADGDGYYDIRLDFTTGGNTSDTFGNGDEITYLISYGPGAITEADFAFESIPGGGTGTYYAAAHVQNTGGEGSSAWIGATEVTPIPEPSSIALASLGLAGLGALTKRRGNH